VNFSKNKKNKKTKKKQKKKSDEAHFLDTHGDEKQLSNLEGLYNFMKK